MMRTFAYCAAGFEESARRAAGVEPLCCPPVSADGFEVTWLEGHEFLYFDLHGEPGQPLWWGDDRMVALRAQQVLSADLSGAIVFATNCFLADEASPMMDALLESGARYVIGGAGLNWAGEQSLYGAALLGMRFRVLLERNFDPLRALALAKRWVNLGLVAMRVLGRRKRAQAIADSLEFRVYYRQRMGSG